ncbi:glycosyltransferase family 39 protein [uncultured Clostridium sp.]|jgi:4-amino-4-deoxy-L-arabinose transferase-like glycosyltransferase|uniref:glycosyltransferase family 39 protein n=1 Tax=uncultured Clostridium sp. TaxID=59620 RepID=UPI0025F1BFC9|nr:glycosyltransferase family 39 protein [uncultured Clostridium sp.]
MKSVKFVKEKLALFAVMALSAVLNLANLGAEGYGNEYYAAGVKSMLVNFKNFFFVSSDPGGFVSIDKPPLGFWIQTLSARVFGFSGWSILLPQALAGVVSVVILYYMVKRSFGKAAALVSALCLAVTPVFVAASRNNTVDNLLVMVLLFACMFLSRAAEKGKFKYLLISLVLVGVGFNIKMLQAYMVIPAVYITYLISAAAPVKKKVKHLVIGTAVLVVVSLSWAAAVDLVPAGSRPFVGSSTNNTVMDLILGHNGIERLSSSGGMGGGPGGNRQGGNMAYFKKDRNPSGAQNVPPNGGFQGGSGGNFKDGSQQNGGPQMQMPQGAGQNKKGIQQMGRNGLSGNFGGQTEAGVTRLFSKNILSDQIVWFLPLSLLGFIAAAIVEKLKIPFDNRKKLDLILWMMWLLPEFIYFSYTKGLFHQYYLTMMAPPAAALSGIGLVSMWKLYRDGSKVKSMLLPASFVVEGALHLMMLSYFYSSISAAVKGIIIAAAVLSFASSALLVIYKNRAGNAGFAKILASLAFAGILVTPSIGSAAAVVHGVNGSMPAAGLELLSSDTGSGNTGMKNRFGSSNDSKELISFLDSHIKNEKYDLVVSSSNAAAEMIIKSGRSIMPLGGFTGSDKILSLSQFKELVKKGEVRYVLTGGMGRNSQDIMSWVQKNGKLVPENQWKNTTSVGKTVNPGEMNSQSLYDLKGILK